MPVSGRIERSPNCVGICIDESKKGFKGRVYNLYSKTPQTFNDITELFYIVDSVMDILNYPAQKVRYRHFKKTKRAFKPVKIDGENKVLNVNELIPEGEDGYLLMVTSRDNATWQGLLYDKKKDVESNFNSEVELIKLFK